MARAAGRRQFQAMGTLSFQYAVGFAVTSLAGMLMFMYGLAMRLLERRTAAAGPAAESPAGPATAIATS